MNNKLLFLLIMVFFVFASSCTQIALKKAAGREYKNKIAEYLNFTVIASYFVYIASSFATIYALKYIPLSVIPVVESCGYVFVAILGGVILKEKMNRRKIIGMIVIIAGVFVFSV